MAKNIKVEQNEALEKIVELNRKVDLFCLCCRANYEKKEDGSITLTCGKLTKKESDLLAERIRFFFTTPSVKVDLCEDVDSSSYMEDNCWFLKAVLTLA